MSGSFSNINNDNLTSNAYTIRKKYKFILRHK